MIAGYYTLREAARRSPFAARTLRRYLRDPYHPLPHLKIGNRVVIAERDLIAWLESHRVVTTSFRALASRNVAGDADSPIAREARQLVAELFNRSSRGQPRRQNSEKRNEHKD